MCWRWTAWWLWVLCLFVRTAGAQMDAVRLEVQPEAMGLAGVVQLGTWTPLSLTLENQSPQPRRVMCEWDMPDADGDIVQARRIVSLNPGPGSRQRVWLYAVPPRGMSSKTECHVRVYDIAPDAGVEASARKLLGEKTLLLLRRIEPGKRVIAMLGAPPNLLGLKPYGSAQTRQDEVEFLTGIYPADMPDRWYGWSIAQTLIWTPEAGDPDSPDFPEAARQALRQWVKRGGHLVIILPSEGQGWTNSSLRDLFPVTGQQIRRVEDLRVVDLPASLGQPRESQDRFVMNWFELPAGHPATVMLRDDQERPWVIAAPMGTGRVTVIGLDISERRLALLQVPSAFTSNHNPVGMMLWPTIFGWRGPVYTDAYLEAEKINRPMFSITDLSAGLPLLLAMRETTGPAILAAILIFGLYWILAGPVGFIVLKHKNLSRHAWLAFAAVILAFTVFSWGAAYLTRNKQTSLRHFTVLDIDAVSATTHARSWFSLFMPSHGRADIRLEEAKSSDIHDTLACPGMDTMSDLGGFIDTQRYQVDAAHPAQVRAPVRATVKTFEADYLTPAAPVSFTALRLTAHRLYGQVRHQLPLPLQDVLVVYYPGKGATPLVFRKRTPWKPGETFDLDGLTGNALVAPPLEPNHPKDPQLRAWKGYLGELLGKNMEMHLPGGGPTPMSDDRLVQVTDMLAFFNLLPPPDFRNENYPRPQSYRAGLGRNMDLSHLAQLRGVLLLGHMDSRTREDAPWFLPLTVDGKPAAATGWTVVRMFLPLHD